MDRTLIVEIFKQESQVVAECVEHDICVQADSVWDALYELGRMFAAYEQLTPGLLGL